MCSVCDGRGCGYCTDPRIERERAEIRKAQRIDAESCRLADEYARYRANTEAQSEHRPWIDGGRY